MCTRHGGDTRPNARGRRRQKYQLLARYGDGVSCPCVHCGTPLTFSALERDRIEPGGSYGLANLQPSCGPCNKARSNKRDWCYAPAPVAAY